MYRLRARAKRRKQDTAGQEWLLKPAHQPGRRPGRCGHLLPKWVDFLIWTKTREDLNRKCTVNRKGVVFARERETARRALGSWIGRRRNGRKGAREDRAGSAAEWVWVAVGWGMAKRTVKHRKEMWMKSLQSTKGIADWAQLSSGRWRKVDAIESAQSG